VNFLKLIQDKGQTGKATSPQGTLVSVTKSEKISTLSGTTFDISLFVADGTPKSFVAINVTAFEPNQQAVPGMIPIKTYMHLAAIC